MTDLGVRASGEVGTACSPPATFTAGAGFAVLVSYRGPGTAPTGVVAAANAHVRTLVLVFEGSSRRVHPNLDGGLRTFPRPAAVGSSRSPLSTPRGRRSGPSGSPPTSAPEVVQRRRV